MEQLIVLNVDRHAWLSGQQCDIEVQSHPLLVNLVGLDLSNNRITDFYLLARVLAQFRRVEQLSLQLSSFRCGLLLISILIFFPFAK